MTRAYPWVSLATWAATLLLFGGWGCPGAVAAVRATGPTPPVLGFAFDAPFGSWMVLQRGPGKAAVYGFAPAGAAVKVALVDSVTGTPVATVMATPNATHQAFGDGWGVRPCPKAVCPPYDMQPFTPFGQPLPTWKALLPPMPPGGDFEVVATCAGPCGGGSGTLVLTNVTFGDVFYASGQVRLGGCRVWARARMAAVGISHRQASLHYVCICEDD
jgi:hypothetical protein